MTRRLDLWAAVDVVVLIVLFCVSAHGHSNSTDTISFEAIQVDGEWIVQFRGYYEHARHHGLLRPSFDKVQSVRWHIIERHNMASSFPSDFCLLSIETDSNAALIDVLNALESNHYVKSVSAQRQVTRTLQSTDWNFTGRSIRRMHPLSSSIDTDETAVPSSPPISSSSSFSSARTPVTSLLDADHLWSKGITGSGVRVAVFDTGIRAGHPHFRNLRERTDWTSQHFLDDAIGHGTFVAGIIASCAECKGFAPDADLFSFRVFTDDQISYTSWFLDAFNYAIHKRIHIINLSIGGPDFMDRPFVDKVIELSANNIIMVSAIGNDGPTYGTLNNPADQMEVIGVGGIDYQGRLASFSSRGMTTWELPTGYGRIKPDIVSFSVDVPGSRIYGGCRSLSGTSVASPVVAGAVALLASVVPVESRARLINPASMKQALVMTAARLSSGGGENVFEQGMGRLHLQRAYEFLREYKPMAVVIPTTLDLTDCPYMWPYCTQPIYFTAMPIIVNTTILNAHGVTGDILSPPVFKATNSLGQHLNVQFTYSRVLWPWVGYLAIHISVADTGLTADGLAEGTITLTVGARSSSSSSSRIVLPLRIRIIPPPPRERRLLWDQFHNLRYPPGYFPLDATGIGERNASPLDWHGDHVHTNFNEWYNHLRRQGYYVEVLGAPYTCFEADYYATLIIPDTEEEFFDAEIAKLYNDVTAKGLSLLVVADWYSAELMQKRSFFDKNTRQWWTPQTGGANIPAINKLLEGFGIQFGDRVYSGTVMLTPSNTTSSSSTSSPSARPLFLSASSSLVRFPRDGIVLAVPLRDETVKELNGVEVTVDRVPIAGLHQTEGWGGRIAVLADSNCLDSSLMRDTPCFWFSDLLLSYTNRRHVDRLFSRLGQPMTADLSVLSSAPSPPIPSVEFALLSKVLARPLPACSVNVSLFTSTNDGAPDAIEALFDTVRSGPFVSMVGPEEGDDWWNARSDVGSGDVRMKSANWRRFAPSLGICLMAAVGAMLMFRRRMRVRPTNLMPIV